MSGDGPAPAAGMAPLTEAENERLERLTRVSPASLSDNRIAELQSFAVALAADLAALRGRVAELQRVLQVHHVHELSAGTIGLPDGAGGWIEINNGAEYSDSAMYERTVAALSGMSPDEAAPMPRGGVSVYWWQAAILLRREKRDAEARATAATAEAARLREALDAARGQADMYIRAWERELGNIVVPKRHHIDALVVTTRRMRENQHPRQALPLATKRLIDAATEFSRAAEYDGTLLAALSSAVDDYHRAALTPSPPEEGRGRG